MQVGAGARGVSLVENQVEHLEHRRQTALALPRARQTERDLGGLDALLGPADPLGHRRLGNQERARDLRGREAADGPERQRDRGRWRQRRVAAHEEQRQSVVLLRAGIGVGRRHESPLGPDLARYRILPPPPCHLASHLVGEPAERDVVEPAARIARHSLRRPPARRRDQRFLHRVFRGGEVVTPTCDGAEHLRRQLAQQKPDAALRPPRPSHLRWAALTCRTSMGMMSGVPPGPGAEDAFAAIS